MYPFLYYQIGIFLLLSVYYFWKSTSMRGPESGWQRIWNGPDYSEPYVGFEFMNPEIMTSAEDAQPSEPPSAPGFSLLDHSLWLCRFKSILSPHAPEKIPFLRVVKHWLRPKVYRVLLSLVLRYMLLNVYFWEWGERRRAMETACYVSCTWE